MASVETVLRRRANRAARRASQERTRAEREKHQCKVAQRMVTRFYGTMPPHLMMLGYLYWQARRCGWDAISPAWAKDWSGRPCDPAEGLAWQFWRALHWKRREELVKLSAFRLIRRR